VKLRATDHSKQTEKTIEKDEVKLRYIFNSDKN